MSSIIDKLGITKSPWGMATEKTRFGKINIISSQLDNKRYSDICESTFNKKNNPDMNLIASAPEMLEALIDLMTCDALKGFHSVIDNSKYSKIVEKATNKSWEEIKDLLK